MIAQAPLKLERTRLSRKPDPNAAIVSLLGLLGLAAIFAVQRQDSFGLSRYLTASYAQVFTHQEYWRLFTAALAHADAHHLGSNSLFFGIFGYLLYGYFGSWVFPALALLSGGLINLLVLPLYPPDATVLGASGIVYFMAAFWLTLHFAIERGVSRTRRLMNALAFTLVLLVPETLQENVSYVSHAVGYALGVVSGALYFLANRRLIRADESWRLVEPDAEEGESEAGGPLEAVPSAAYFTQPEPGELAPCSAAACR